MDLQNNTTECRGSPANGRRAQSVRPPLHVMLTVNAAWNVWNFRRPVVKALLEAGHRVTILAPDGERAEDLRAMGCRFVPLEMNVKGLNPVQDYRLMQRFTRIFYTQAPDVVLSYTIKNNLFGAMAARTCGIPFIPNVTGLGTAFLSGGALQRVAEILYRRAFRNLQTVFFQNSDDRDLFIARQLVTAEQAHILPGSGIDLEDFPVAPYSAGANETRFLLIGRLLRDKGIHEYIGAARRLKAKGIPARFQLLGAAGSENRTAISRETLADWEAEGVVEYLGTTSDVRPHIAQAHCVVLPSYREGAPRTLIEAASMARPLIASNVPGCTTVVDDGVNGYLCTVKSGESLAEACIRFVRLPEVEKVAMGLSGRAKMVAEFDQAIVVAAYKKEIAARTSKRTPYFRR
ncbi:glycosyltransferase family 4 protein [Roseibium sp.]|uniref:glycosyltransferase family 4 protein n=1 Tax=Roseibium sp. TaxID=1936156 RepID=UPI00329A2FCB